ncbi:M14 family zinc carboxypeptidase [Empedobacter stercoris]|uniref:M14 family zinc carboxypeptidase n=1 Tax=Empedobacter falsenii TaxID=343874 RepID=A0ABY8V9G6_9FLAO|nr:MULTISPECIES: M14 family zinc carboxypeptidase [Empedobacter]MDM1522884.1 peptidase M14 [Empedobacter sp. 225-1]MDM1542823.1 peptidase M14 [Empedobacter sp. 189-2]UWX67604.1 M14 family zinc carboxypeptidase [Empedobacter stercoris]WIH97792.1 M14 family zinc carboxypeptidase [Empedobacter falsenii]HJD85875.1 peptidase M14 [Empedobacter falsenii]
MFDIQQLDQEYSTFKQEGFDLKWLNFEDLKNYFSLKSSQKEQIGTSFLGNEIYKLSFGTGEKRLLIWSQMHGNESSGTRAMFDVINFFEQKSELAQTILSQLTIDFIPMLNPDGANVNTRRNAVGIDINRDFLAKQSTEIHILLDQVVKGNYQTLFNLHDQRTIFNVGQTAKPATLSFLAPSYNVEEDVNEVREKTMGIIQSMNTALQQVIPGQVGRYTSEFYPMSTGDNFTKMGYPCVLFEAGHFANDYQRNTTRKYNALAILAGLNALATQDKFPFDNYLSIPQNGQKYLDILIRNVQLKNEDKFSFVDLGIYFEDEYNEENNTVDQMAKIVEIGDLRKFIGHLEIDAKKQIYKGVQKNYPILNQLATFEIGSIKFKNGRLID